MPNMQDRKAEQFSRYDAMSTKDLQAFLREDASKPMGEESDTEEIFYVMEVLAKRRKEQNGGKLPVEALESFKQNYHTENETPYISESVPVARKRSSSGRWKRGLVAAVAAICILVIGNSITASALDFDLFAIIAKWTQETFHFGYAGQMDETNAPSPDHVNPCASLQEALDKRGITTALVPTWMPGGYTESDLRITETPAQRLFMAKYEYGEDVIKIRIADYLDNRSLQVEQSESLIEVYQCAGIDYYIFENEGQLQVVWIHKNCECYIAGSFTLSEIKTMIDSIEKG
ncbi:MAG: DUF4367 domain-containing protein [Oscillospiraceae bacterium]|nr:DUF4367 domain-containing protein [Oscillospiraceae bacterium]